VVFEAFHHDALEGRNVIRSISINRVAQTDQVSSEGTDLDGF